MLYPPLTRALRQTSPAQIVNEEEEDVGLGWDCGQGGTHKAQRKDAERGEHRG